MKTKYKQIARRQLDTTLAMFGEAKRVQFPAKGWIRAVREALGMSGKQLAQRLHVSQPRVYKLEQSEPSGALTLKTMRQVAEALDCVSYSRYVKNINKNKGVEIMCSQTLSHP
ncbi:MAG: helix-turn-helix domain-containing protein [Desulfocapsa sp.]|jgi:predicted DNA-binding mobile mystery protein A|nr:helix-turn-helix domain-containing protein [Desulfocapsa sp.]